MPNVNWNKIKNEYINGNTSYRKLAKKYGVSFNTLQDRAIKEKWTELKASQHDKITTKTRQKTAEKIAEKESNRIIDITEANYCIYELFKEKIADNDFREEVKAKDMKALSSMLKDIQDIQNIANGGNKNTETNKLDTIVKNLLNGEREN